MSTLLTVQLIWRQLEKFRSNQIFVRVSFFASHPAVLQKKSYAIPFYLKAEPSVQKTSATQRIMHARVIICPVALIASRATRAYTLGTYKESAARGLGANSSQFSPTLLARTILTITEKCTRALGSSFVFFSLLSCTVYAAGARGGAGASRDTQICPLAEFVRALYDAARLRSRGRPTSARARAALLEFSLCGAARR